MSGEPAASRGASMFHVKRRARNVACCALTGRVTTVVGVVGAPRHGLRSSSRRSRCSAVALIAHASARTSMGLAPMIGVMSSSRWSSHVHRLRPSRAVSLSPWGAMNAELVPGWRATRLLSPKTRRAGTSRRLQSVARRARDPQRVPASSIPRMTSHVSQLVGLSACSGLAWPVSRGTPELGLSGSSTGWQGGDAWGLADSRAPQPPLTHPSTIPTPRPGRSEGRHDIPHQAPRWPCQLLERATRDAGDARRTSSGWRRWRSPAPPPVIAGAVAGGVAVAEAPCFARLRQLPPVVTSGGHPRRTSNGARCFT